ncbi:hypothetical protein MYX78_01280 [Acidobacteria bacterium AH-259-G07]|nr:hypothetical protein [Acidobacteria bacterium AH-259-G07]
MRGKLGVQAVALFVTLFFFLGLFLSTGPQAPAGPSERVSVVVDSKLGPPAQHGLKQLVVALEGKGVKVERRDALRREKNQHVLVIGRSSGSRAVRQLAEAAGLTLPRQAEALLLHNISWNNKDALLICGADDRGLMYAALDVAEQIRLADEETDPLASISNASEKPAIQERSVTRMIMNRAVAEKYFYSEQYWDRYLNMLAKYRYNTFTLMFGYGSAGYFEPPYPFLFDVPEFPEVQVIGITKQEQKRNLRMLNKIIDMTHERGLNFSLALWTHIFVPGQNNFIREGELRAGFPTGLTQENLIPYTKVALKKFLELVPNLDRFLFRVHVESSVTLPEQRHFWTEVLKVIQESRPEIPIDMRVKGLTDDLIEAALKSRLKVRLTTKHWGEEMGLPFHPTQDSLANKYKRRHTYADLLRYPRRYDMLYRLWSHGTVRVLLWGDPDHARRFAQSTRLYDGVGFDLHEHLAMKMGYKMGLHQGPSYEVLAKEYQYYQWEFERYWHYYQLFGRLGYNLDTPPRVWRAEFEHRFGKEAAPFIEQAYARASKVLPRIVGYATRNLSSGFTWPEKQRWEDLPDYINVRPSDTAQFLGIEEAAGFHLAGKTSPKIWPQENSRWFAKTWQEVLRLVEEAEKRIGSYKNKEFISTMIDMKVLAHLAAYHSHRLHAGLNLALFEETGDLNALDDAIRHERDAIENWQKIVEVTDGVYPDNIIMGRPPRMSGSWKTELEALKTGLAKLEKRRDSFEPQYRKVVARLDFGDGPVEEGLIGVTSGQEYSLSKGGYGWHHGFLSPSPKLSDRKMEKERYRDFLHGPEPREYPYSAFGIDLPNGEYELLFSMVDRSDQPREHGPMWIVAQGKNSTERFTVPAGQLVEKTLRAKVVDGRLNVVLNSTTDGDWMVNSLVLTRVEPAIGHVPIRKTSGQGDVVIQATVAGRDSIRSTHLVYGSAKTGYKQIPMSTMGRFTYQASIPQSDLMDGLSYFIEAVDKAGREAWFPRKAADQPIRMAVTNDNQAPVVAHQKIRKWTAGKSLVIRAEVTDASSVESVHVRYRGVNQHQDFHRLRMLPTGRGNEYRAEIPGGDIDSRWDFMYYIEAVDKYGNGKIYPDLDVETPYVVVNLHKSTVSHADGP